MSRAEQTIKHMTGQIASDWTKYVTELTKNLRAGTPRREGAARAAWKKVGKLTIGSGQKKIILSNAVGYASILDGSEGKPTSKKAPRGIVKPALRKTKQK